MNNFDDLITAGGERKPSPSARITKEEWAAKKQQERTDAFELLDTRDQSS